MKKYDVIVIGAGNGGLAAAVTILQGGKSCLVLEKHNIPGGFATSFVRGRFEFEASLHELNGMGQGSSTGSTYALFEELGVIDKIEWLQIKNAYRLIALEEGIDFTMPTGIDNIIEAAKTICEDGDKYMKRFIDMSINVADAMTYIGMSKGKPDMEVMKEKYMDYLKYGSYSVDKVFEMEGFPKKIQQIISAYWSYLGTRTADLNFAHYANMTYKYYLFGAVAPKYRSHEMSLAFEKRIHELGGDIFYNCEVSRILTDVNGDVEGVELTSGEKYMSRHVIANMSPHTVYGKMLDKKVVPEGALKLANFRKIAGRGITIFLGLNKSPEELGITDHSYFVYDTADSNVIYEKMKNLDSSAGQATVCLNHVVPNCSPPGTTILYITSLYMDDVWAEVEEKDYFKKKNEVARRFIEKFELATGAKKFGHIEELAIATPVTYARYGGHPQGTIYGYESQPLDALMARAQMVNDDASIKGLRMCGGFGDRLLGYSSAYKSGLNEAKRTLNDIKKEEQHG